MRGKVSENMLRTDGQRLPKMSGYKPNRKTKNKISRKIKLKTKRPNVANLNDK